MEDATSSENSIDTLLSVGVGALAEMGEHCFANIYYAVPMKDAGTTEGGDAGLWHFSFILRW